MHHIVTALPPAKAPAGTPVPAWLYPTRATGLTGLTRLAIRLHQPLTLAPVDTLVCGGPWPGPPAPVTANLLAALTDYLAAPPPMADTRDLHLAHQLQAALHGHPRSILDPVTHLLPPPRS